LIGQQNRAVHVSEEASTTASGFFTQGDPRFIERWQTRQQFIQTSRRTEIKHRVVASGFCHAQVDCPRGAITQATGSNFASG